MFGGGLVGRGRGAGYLTLLVRPAVAMPRESVAADFDWSQLYGGREMLFHLRGTASLCICGLSPE